MPVITVHRDAATKTVDVGGTSFAYRDLGPRTSTPVIFLNHLADLSRIQQAVLVANGDHDRMVPSHNSADLARRLPNAQLKIYSDAGHAGIFQYHAEFVPQALAFLAA